MSSKDEVDEIEISEEVEEEMTDDELDELMMQQSKSSGCKKHRGYGKFDKPAVNRGVALKSDSDKGNGEKEKQK